jgi:hypothetical protein
VQGTFTNASNSSVYQNDGILEVKGDFVNTGTATFQVGANASNDRVVKFVGSTKQHIIGNMNTSGTQSFYNAEISQANASDTVEMDNNALVEGSLVFGNTTTTTYNPSAAWTNHGSTGLLKTFADNTDPTQQYLLSVENGDNDAIAGYATLAISSLPTTGYILTQGTRGNAQGSYVGLQRNVANNNSAYVWPIGTVGHGYNPVRMNFTSLPGGAQDVVAKFSDGTSNASGYEGNLTDYCNACDNGPQPLLPYFTPSFNYLFGQNPCYGNQELWVILEQTTTNHGYWDIASPTAASPQYWVEMFPNNFSSNQSPLGAVRILKYDSVGLGSLAQYYVDPTNNDWTSQILSSISTPNDLVTYSLNTGNCYTGSGYPGGLYSGFSHFALFGEHGADALPVTLIDLTATPEDNTYIQVGWATALEINNAGFYVMRSTDGINYTNISWVPGHDNSVVTQSYAYNDYDVVPNVVYYYKLDQVDNNGISHFTYTVSAQLNGSGLFTISDFIPNPTRNGSKIIISTSTAQNIDVKLYDILGRELSSKPYSLSPGQNTLDFDVQTLADATYTAIITAGDKVYSKKLVVTHF